MKLFIHAATLATVLLTTTSCSLGDVFAYEPSRVPMSDVQARMARGDQMVVVDVRSPYAYQNEHAAGAINLPFVQMRSMPKSVKLPKDKWALLYCT